MLGIRSTRVWEITMSKTKELINDILVDLFNYILRIEEEYLKNKGVNLTMNEVHILEAIQKSEVSTMKDIATRLHVTQSTLTTSVNKLVDRGYVKKHKIIDDRRKTLLGLRLEGVSVLKTHSEFHDLMVEKISGDYDLKNQAVLLESLSRLKDFFCEIQEEQNERSN